MGYKSSREASNDGHTFKLGWLNRPPAVVQRLKWYFEQYEHGFFTIIDHDGDGRQYVGHFTGEWPRIPNGFLRADVQLTFEEAPGAPMLQYPDKWERDAIDLFVNSDWNEQIVSTSGTWVTTVHQADQPYKTLDNDGARAGEWAQIEYRGYGFQVRAARAPGMGIWQVWLDGVQVGQFDANSAEDDGPAVLFSWGAVPLDIHRIKLVATATTSGTGKALNLLSFKVMR
jgi:hypothetical protein